MLHLNTPVVGEFVVHIQSGSLGLVLLYWSSRFTKIEISIRSCKADRILVSLWVLMTNVWRFRTFESQVYRGHTHKKNRIYSSYTVILNTEVILLYSTNKLLHCPGWNEGHTVMQPKTNAVNDKYSAADTWGHDLRPERLLSSQECPTGCVFLDYSEANCPRNCCQSFTVAMLAISWRTELFASQKSALICSFVLFF